MDGGTRGDARFGDGLCHESMCRGEIFTISEVEEKEWSRFGLMMSDKVYFSCMASFLSESGRMDDPEGMIRREMIPGIIFRGLFLSMCFTSVTLQYW
jgi:hypothetical protein